MKGQTIVVLGICVLAATGCAKGGEAPVAEVAIEAGASEGVHMDSQTQARMGVHVASAAAASAHRTVKGFARVLDVGPLAAIESEVSAAEAAASASESEYRRLASLAAQDQAASARSVEAAQAQATADRARAKLAARRIGFEWGAGLERLSGAERSRLLTDIANGRAVLLRIDAPGANAAASRASVRPEENGPAIPVAILGAAAAADARLQTAGLLGLVRGDAAQTLPTGRLLQADLELGASETGFLLPASALIRTSNSVWVYLQTGADAFERRDVSAGRAVADGWFVGDGFKPDEQVVVEGATSLLAAENGPVEAE
ncbi:MAG: hypothetical protein Q8R02_19340 [Hyphomonadaceae bacterium]|nr:hypothetical protein [Hyphomonadaceae bacterium]